LEILRARRFMSIWDRVALVIFSLIFIYNWIDPRTPVPADNTALRILTYLWVKKSFSEMAHKALSDEMIRIGMLNLDDSEW
jgi:hypothetical protein